MPAEPTTIPAANNALPLFYTKPRMLDREGDAKKRIKKLGDFSFAAKANAIPLVIDEFFIAATNYPIVFLQSLEPVPAVVVGIEPNQNLFVQPDGSWKQNAYIPAYARRYPFILVDDPQNKQLLLCVDEASSLFSDEGEHALFKNGEPAEVTENALQFCSVLRQQGEATDVFVKALLEQRLLTQQEVAVTMPDGKKQTLNGFLNIDEEKFRALPDSIYLDWRQKGWIGYIHAHLVSQYHWLHFSQHMKP